MINVLLNVYEFDAPWARDVLGGVLKQGMKACVLTMSHGREIPDGAGWDRAYGWGGFIRRDLERAFGAYGIQETDISFVSWFHDTAQTAARKLDEADVLFLTGGLPDVFFERMQAMKLVERLQQFPGVVMGASAGAMVQFLEYHITPDEDYDAYCYHQGLGLLDGFELEVHFADTPVQRECMARYQKERGKPLWAMCNDGGLLVRNGEITPMGRVFQR